MSVVDEIRKLSELHKEGLLTEEEFAAQKAKLLAGDAPSGLVSPAKSQVADEVVFMQDGDVFVSSHRIQLGSQTFATQNVSSVALTKEVVVEDNELDNRVGCLGMGCALFAYLGLFEAAHVVAKLIGVAFAVAAFFLFKLQLKAYEIHRLNEQKPPTYKWFVQITGGGSNTNALWSYNRDYIAAVVAACEKAITHRI